MNRRRIQDDLLQEMLSAGKSYKLIGEAMGVSSAAICKRLKRLKLQKPPESFNALTEKEKSFAIAVVSGQSRINAVMQTYDVTSRASAKSMQQDLMKDPDIKLAISELMERQGMGRAYRVEKLKQHLESPDPVISLKALDMSMKAADDAGERKGRNMPEITIVFREADLSQFVDTGANDV